jgi:AcrR family transcriptional regulator
VVRSTKAAKPEAKAAKPDSAVAALSAPKARIIEAALDLFACCGVGGTSLQMIADEIGVTKAAIYHQYNTKEEIVIAAAEAELARFVAVIKAAELETSQKRARDAVIEGIINLAVDRRRIIGTILSDPVIGAYFSEHDAFREVMNRLRKLLVGTGAAPDARVQTGMVVAAIGGSVMHPFASDLKDDVLRAQLLKLARGFLGLHG